MNTLQSWKERIKSEQDPIVPIIGIVYSTTSPDPNDKLYAEVTSALTPKNLGCAQQLIDYHAFMLDFRARHAAKTEAEQQRLLYVEVLDFVRTSGLSGIVFPGNYYNMVGSCQNPDNSRKLLQGALLEVCRNLRIPLLAVCGGEQYIAHHYGAEITPATKDVTGTDHAASLTTPVHGIHIKLHTILAGAHEDLELRQWYSDASNKHRFPSQYDIVSDSYQERQLQPGTTWKNSASSNELYGEVNSMHNQSVLNTESNTKKLGENNLEIAAVDPTRKIIESYEQTSGAPVMCTQFHPEYLITTADRRYMLAFVEAAETRCRLGKLDISGATSPAR